MAAQEGEGNWNFTGWPVLDNPSFSFQLTVFIGGERRLPSRDYF